MGEHVHKSSLLKYWKRKVEKMALSYLHHHPEFPELIRIVGEEKSIDPALIEKDYWIMHCLFGLQQAGMLFELKGGTSLSKGYGIIHRFSEDIDIRIEPPSAMKVPTGHNQNKPAQCQRRLEFYDWLTKEIRIDGIYECQRDTIFDDKKYRSGGIRLFYRSISVPLEGLKTGILLEVGFDTVTPNEHKDISSWAYEFAASKVPLLDNRPKGVPCYHPGYTLVEKLQTISTKFRKQQKTGEFSENFMRHYYDCQYACKNDPPRSGRELLTINPLIFNLISCLSMRAGVRRGC